MRISELKNNLVAVLGYGMEGRAVTKYLLKNGVKPVIFDQKTWDQQDQQARDEIRSLGLNFIFGPDSFKEMAGFKIAFRSPGIPLDEPGLQAAVKKGLRLTSQTSWFFEHCKAKIIGITGTKGKGTTSALIYEALKRSAQANRGAFKAYLTGNIGKIQPLDFLDRLRPADWVVYELSSFQLQDLKRSPHIGVILMVTSEHLDYHKSPAEYVNAKAAIARFQQPNDFAVINSDYKNSLKIGKLGKGKKYFISRLRPTAPGCYVRQGWIYLKLTGRAPQKICSIGELKLKGEHNLENACAAIAAARLAGAELKPIQDACANFTGLEHRLQLVAQKKGLKFYNDSFSTAPETAIAAIKAFSEPLILILGGSSKNSDFRPLAREITAQTNIKAIILIGQESPRLKNLLKSFSGKLLEGPKSMKEIFAQIKSVAQKGDTVLLSPACASFGMFKNYKDRGEQFTQWAKNW